MRAPPRPAQRSIAWLSLGVLVLALGINGLSAWIRHTEAGLACAVRPACYGLVGAALDDARAAVRRAGAAAAALEQEALAKRVHRALATGLVIAMLVLLHRARRPGLLAAPEVRLSYAMAALLLVLAVIGPASYLKTLPAVATANLVGGVLLAACAWRLWLGTATPVPTVSVAAHARLPDLALSALLLQIALGAWQSANFAGMVCAGGRSCQPSFEPGALASAAWYLRELPLDAAGRVQTLNATVLIHLAHRAGAVLAGGLLLALAVRAARTRPQLRAESALLVALLFVQIGLGVTALRGELPLAVVLAHNAVATLLLLALLRLRHRLREAAPA
jgi:cytochrome c oxidase assembly protein subunit 15